MLQPTEIVGVVAAALTGLVIFAVLLTTYWYLAKKRRTPKSPDYSAIGDFKPTGVFSWDSTTSITKSLQEEHHSVQPKINQQSLYGHLCTDDVSVHSSSTASTTSSLLSRASVQDSIRSDLVSMPGKDRVDAASLHSSASSVRSKYSRCRTLSEMSEASSVSQDSASFDTASLGIKPELYTRKDSVLRQESSVAVLGRLHVRLNYDFRTSDLIVHLIEAQDLHDFKDSPGFNDPYVKIQLTPGVDSKNRQSSIKRQTRSPLFNEYFKFAVGYDDLREKTLIFTVLDFDKFSHNELVGEVKVDFSQIDVSTTVEMWCDIEPTDKWEDGSGELLVSLSFLPTAERLTAIVIKAKNLKQPKPANKINPIVRVNFLLENKVIKRWKTSVQKSTTNPVWNEAVVLSVSPQQLDHLVVEFVVTDHDLLGTGGACIGSCQLGKMRSGVEGLHWAEMKQSLRRGVARWHMLH